MFWTYWHDCFLGYAHDFYVNQILVLMVDQNWGSSYEFLYFFQDKTFGLKNKKGKKQQTYIKNVTHQVCTVQFLFSGFQKIAEEFSLYVIIGFSNFEKILWKITNWAMHIYKLYLDIYIHIF